MEVVTSGYLLAFVPLRTSVALSCCLGKLHILPDLVTCVCVCMSHTKYQCIEVYEVMMYCACIHVYMYIYTHVHVHVVCKRK